ncbi:MAG: hypothetical protein LBQ27_06020 [Clostridiales bacterium]|jgi:beta-mannosidase|nr:hypothetical protein [Clostridiales bacterium]
MKILSLNGDWLFRENGTGEWASAKVPGSNFTDLMRNGLIPDPFIGVNEKDEKVRSVALKDWEYKRSFEVDDEFLKFEKIELVCNSLDTLADVYLNEEKIFTANNMFKQYVFDLKRYLLRGENNLRVVFYSPVKSSKAKGKNIS